MKHLQYKNEVKYLLITNEFIIYSVYIQLILQYLN